MDTNNLTEGTLNRLRRIQKLKNYSEKDALEFSISIGWLAAEKQAAVAKIMKKVKDTSND